MRRIATLTCGILWVACAATTDWQARIGSYSLDEATRELGPPESCVGLDDGGTACSWTTSKGARSVDKLILTFDPMKRLTTANNVRL